MLLSIGGDSYHGWDKINTAAIKNLVDDLGLDGVGIDFEAGCDCQLVTDGSGASTRSCPYYGSLLTNVTAKLRAAMPRGKYLLLQTAVATGAYGKARSAFALSEPQSSDCVGLHLAQAQSPAGRSIDLVDVMAYCIGTKNTTGYDPKEDLRANVWLWPNAKVVLGMMVPPESKCWGEGYTTAAMAKDYAKYAITHGGAGMMMWSLGGKGTPPGPSANDLARAVCKAYSPLLGNCTGSLPLCDSC